MTVEISGCCPLFAVFDMPRSVEFYCTMLGFEIVETSQAGPPFGWALLRRNDVELMLNTAYERDERPVRPDLARNAAHSDTTLYFSCSQIDALYTQLRAAGLSLEEPRVAPYGMKQLSFNDPDGYGLCFQWPSAQNG